MLHYSHHQNAQHQQSVTPTTTVTTATIIDKMAISDWAAT
jgi:hypothetical protein